jgi:hypothetical protein
MNADEVMAVILGKHFWYVPVVLKYIFVESGAIF